MRCYGLPQHALGCRKIKVAYMYILFCFTFVLPQHGVRSDFRNSGIRINLTMLSSSGQGVTAVMLPRFSTTGGPRRNCAKIGVSSMDGMTVSPHRKHQLNKEWIPCPWSQSGLQKGKLWQLSAPPLLVTKNSKTLYTAFNYQKKKQRKMASCHDLPLQ